eukprot:1195943-Prorocentrum_minimum.AAC.2
MQFVDAMWKPLEDRGKLTYNVPGLLRGSYYCCCCHRLPPPAPSYHTTHIQLPVLTHYVVEVFHRLSGHRPLYRELLLALCRGPHPGILLLMLLPCWPPAPPSPPDDRPL